MVLPVPGRHDLANVYVDSQVVARVAEVAPRVPWRDFTDKRRIGKRWVPEHSPADMPGPYTRQEAALVALVMAGYNPRESMTALHLSRYVPAS